MQPSARLETIVDEPPALGDAPHMETVFTSIDVERGETMLGRVRASALGGCGAWCTTVSRRARSACLDLSSTFAPLHPRQPQEGPAGKKKRAASPQLARGLSYKEIMLVLQPYFWPSRQSRDWFQNRLRCVAVWLLIIAYVMRVGRWPRRLDGRARIHPHTHPSIRIYFF